MLINETRTSRPCKAVLELHLRGPDASFVESLPRKATAEVSCDGMEWRLFWKRLFAG